MLCFYVRQIIGEEIERFILLSMKNMKIVSMANVYCAYLRQLVGSLTGSAWETTTAIFEILERLLPQDIRDLEKVKTEGATKEKFSDHAGLLKLYVESIFCVLSAVLGFVLGKFL